METVKWFVAGAGFGIWPTLLFGVAALGLSGAHASKPRAHWMPLIVGTGAATLLSGALAFVTGLVNCFTVVVSVGPPDSSRIALAGIVESLGNLEVAFAATALVALLAGIGSFRVRRVPAVA